MGLVMICNDIHIGYVYFSHTPSLSLVCFSIQIVYPLVFIILLSHTHYVYKFIVMATYS